MVKSSLKNMQKLPKKFFERDAVAVAKDLLGCVLEKDDVSGMIVETEAYSDDEASHAFTKTPRSILMHETYGHTYVYFTYGMHYCFNVTCDNKKQGAVLIRALLPIKGVSKMKKRRKMSDEKNLTNGPAKLTQSLNIHKKYNGTEIGENIHIYRYKKFSPKQIKATPRIGISKAKDLLWRFVVKT